MRVYVRECVWGQRECSRVCVYVIVRLGTSTSEDLQSTQILVHTRRTKALQMRQLLPCGTNLLKHSEQDIRGKHIHASSYETFLIGIQK